jgi:lysyl-tRNA synthetase class 2
MLEYYRLGASYMDIADELLDYLRVLNGGKKTLSYQGRHVSLDRWEKLSVDEAFVRYAGLTRGDIFDREKIMRAGATKGYVVDGFTYEDVFSQIYVQDVEPHLGTNGFPTLLHDYPQAFAALAKLNTDGQSAQRFEFYINGVELGDCYSELTNPNEQRARFEHESAARVKSGLIDHAVDWGFVEALEYGLKECSGIAIGFDRLAMVFCDLPSIHDLRLIDVV